MREGDFPIRGKEISRVEGLSDAVFGFAITLPAISLEVPKTSGEVLHALRGVGAFAVTFLLLFNMRRMQYTFFRRYGLDDNKVVKLTGALLFVLLLFVYPLEFIMGVIPTAANAFGNAAAAIVIVIVSAVAIAGQRRSRSSRRGALRLEALRLEALRLEALRLDHASPAVA